MGCVSSHLLNHEDKVTKLGSSALSQHIVSLTSTTYGLLTLDPPPSNQPLAPSTPPTPPTLFPLGSASPLPLSEPKSLWSEPEIINSWELMAGLDADSFRFKPFTLRDSLSNKENSNPNFAKPINQTRVSKPFSDVTKKHLLDKFERICPPNGENRVVVYTTSLRGIRKTFEACNGVKAVIEGAGFLICERDISMDRGFREELRELMKEKGREAMVPPRVFVKGKYIGGIEELSKVAEEGRLTELLEGLPKKRVGSVCEGCGDARFLPCFHCSGSCKLAMAVKEETHQKQRRFVVVHCPNCNENGLVICAICS